MPDNLLTVRLADVRARIRRAERQFGRPLGSVSLIAVSKTKNSAAIRAAAALGQRDFGENYVQEFLGKAIELADLSLCWHFIGHLQSNKTREVAAHCDWIHTVDRERVARRLNDQRPSERSALNVCIQVNLHNESNKAGVAPEKLEALAAAVRDMPRLRLRGLMAIPEAETDFQRQRKTFAEIHQIAEELRQRGTDLDTLSMGMTGDMEAAIAEGATHVRIGTAIFGPRAAR
ncbi:MAG: YggS family pyridoxal phosphate-dependent enzyme [Gammaproteobacteria bacterium]|nr:YggS family pyridoxal phosphate-dependent enzyme [Gammaproteobacteria bacterium]MDH3467057.1 YggS family pyridoxal phosphate-dependent enzyme [Gammaproteobacteria bacterium]